MLAARRAVTAAPLAISMLLLAACGSRSDLLGASPSTEGDGGGGGGGAGGATTTFTTTGTAGSGGGGGQPLGTCDVLVVDGPPRSPKPAFEGWEHAAPHVTSIEADTSRAALSYLEAKTIPGGALQASSVALDAPWGAWPDELGTSAPHTPTLGFAAGPGLDGRLSLFMSDEPNAAGKATGMVVWFPNAGVPGAQGQYFDDLLPGYPLFVTAREGEWLAGFQRLVGNGLHHLSLARITSPLSMASLEPAAGCGISAALAGAAIPLKEGFLVAVSSGRPYGTCFEDNLSDGPPSTVHVVRFPGALNEPEPLAKDDVPGTYVFQIHATPSATGAWVAWERIPTFNPPTERWLTFVRLDAGGTPEYGFFGPPTGEVGIPFAIAALGDLPVLVTTRQDPSGSRVLEVQVLDQSGGVFGQITLSAEGGFLMDASVDVVASPAGNQLLVAWAETPVTGGTRRVRVARLACAGGL